MSNRDTEIVSVICLEIAQRLGTQRYDLYFSETTFKVAGECVRVCAPNRFAADWLRAQFRQDVEQVCRAVLGTDAKVEFCVASQSNSSEQASLSLVSSPAERMKGPSSAASSDSGGSPESSSFTRRRFANLNSFVAGESNQIAYTSVRSIVKTPGRMSPLFVYGPTGVGKSHLLEGLWNEFRRMPNRPRCLYVSAEQFTAAFLDNLHGRGMPRFRRRFRDVDLLVIEDVQFFAGKTATINELQYTIDSLLREGRQLAFSADRSPADLDKLGPDLVNRFCGGLVLSVDAPDRQTRERIVASGAAERGLDLPDSVMHLIADRLTNDVRKLQGALNRLQVYSQAYGQAVTMDLALDALAEILRGERRNVNLRDIEEAVCEVFGVAAVQLKSPTKSRNVTQARQLAMWLARKHTRAALTEIGEHFGRRSHSTVISAEKKVNLWRDEGTLLRVTDRDCSVDEAIERVQMKLQVG